MNKNDDERTLNFDNFQKEIGTTETMRTACAAWSNTFNYRPKNPRYIIFGVQKRKEDIFHEDMFLYTLVQSGEYKRRICLAQSPNNKLTEMREHFTFCLHNAHLASFWTE